MAVYTVTKSMRHDDLVRGAGEHTQAVWYKAVMAQVYNTKRHALAIEGQ